MKKSLGLLALLLGVSVIAAVVSVRPRILFPRPAHQNVVIIMIDTLRPDHLGAYGYARDTSPEIDRLAAAGTVFTRAYSASNWTNPAITAIFTGQSPQAVMREAVHQEAIRMPLPTGVATYAELVGAAGYRTAALVDHPGINASLAFNRGFDHYTMLYKQGAGGRGPWGKSDVDFVADRFAERLDASGGGPFLIYLHVVYPHRPYGAPAPYSGLFGPEDYAGYSEPELPELINAYDSEIRRTDDLVGRVRAALASRDLLKSTWTILLADHGEAFWEHGFEEHGNAFYDEAIKVPLILVPPAGTTGHQDRVDAPVSNMDVFATILDIAGVQLPAGTKGVSLVGPIPSSAARESRVLFSESAHSYDIHARAIIQRGFKYIDYPGRSPAEHFLFDLVADPAEQHNLYDDNQRLVETLQRLLRAHAEEAVSERERLAQRTVEPSAETLEGLRSLGYLR